MSKLFQILLVLYIICILFHLYFCHYKISLQRKMTKIILMPLLGSLYYFGTPKEKFSKNVLAAVLFGFLGDIFLLVDDPFSPLVTLGIFSFFIGHLLYMVSFLRETGINNYKKYFLLLLVISIIFFFGENIAFKYLKDGFAKGNVMIPGICYLTLLALLNIASCFYTITYFNIYSFLTFFGSLVFFTSDFILVRKMFYEDNKYYHVTLMATYILAQSLICFGLSHRRNKYEIKIEKIN